MRFSIFTTLPPVGRSPDQVLRDFREQVVLAEELGFHAVWIGEHHFQPFGGGDLPNAILIGADIAARTSRIRIGQMANIAVWWHPIRLAEDLAILDNLTEGRIEVGFGRGMQIFLDPGEEIDAGTRLDWDFLEPRSFLVGSPAHVIERLEEHREVCNPEEILIGYAHDGVDQRKTLRNIERFGTEVMPHFRSGGSRERV